MEGSGGGLWNGVGKGVGGTAVGESTQGGWWCQELAFRLGPIPGPTWTTWIFASQGKGT